SNFGLNNYLFDTLFYFLYNRIIMYSRQLIKAPKKIVQNGKIQFGSFFGVSDTVDIRGVKAPFAGVPTSTFFSNFRIKSRIAFAFAVDNYIGLAEFFDDKAFGLAEVIFWDKETEKKYAYHTFMGPSRRFIPINTQESGCTSYAPRYIKINWSRKRHKLSLSFTVIGDKFRPAAKAKYIARFGYDEKSEMLSVTPSPTMQRCSATWIVPLNLEGGLSTAKHRHYIKEIPQEKGLGLMLLNRTYLKIRTSSEIMIGLVTIGDKNITFTFSNNTQSPVDEDNYNDNMISVNGKITAMPPVLITHPFGISKKWIAQDTEGMVDLTFNPISVNSRTLNIVLMRNAYTTIYGTFEGVLVSDDGEKIVLKNCPGIVKKSHIRL
ncbi:MAG: DUF2804 domain-containing protein, partial [Spirochaetia bacterium]|nr:DUF2804 domain-containing protein [Spirochaetia bacterium]